MTPEERSAAAWPSGPLSVCVVGLGYVGLPTAGILAARGHRVTGVDVRPEVVDAVNRGRIHIHEPNLGPLVRTAVQQGRLTASSAPQRADVFLICVPTPITPDHRPDLSYVQQAAQAIRPVVQSRSLIVLESTSPPGTTEKIIVPQAVPAGMVVGRDVFVAYCPERILPGRILIEAVRNDRIVGGITPACTERAKRFLETFVEGTVWPTNAAAAELVKLAENAFRDVNIAFANELSLLADCLGADPFQVIQLANKHPRVNILTPGPGVGGHCISVDPWFLVHAAPHLSPLVRTARQVNDQKPRHVVEAVAVLARRNRVRVIGCLGLTYKADVDDLRESPSLAIVRQLRDRRLAEVLVCDPYVRAARLPDLTLSPLEQVLQQSDLLVLLTDHAPFRDISPDLLRQKIVVDTRGIWRSVLRQAAVIAPQTAEGEPIPSRKQAA